PTIEEIEATRIRIEVERQASEAAEKLRKQRETFEHKQEREKKMIEWAEYLFKKNPEGKMFEPDYTETLSMLLETIQLQMEDVLPEEGLDDDLVQILQPEESVSDISEIIMKDVCEKKPPPVLIPEEIVEYEIDEAEKEEWTFSEQSNDEDKA
ncbi:hypothetical protein HN011_004357, partial [Eciton burchellii]